MSRSSRRSLSGLEKALGPLAWSWSLYFYMFGVQSLATRGVATNLWLGAALFLPVAIAEFFCTGRFLAIHNKPAASRRSRAFLIPYLGNLLLWILFYSGFVLYIFFSFKYTPAMQFYAPVFLRGNILMWRTLGWVAWVLLLYWGAAYFLVCVKWGRLRLLTTLFLPFLITAVIFVIQWKYGGIGYASEEKIVSQAGVENVLRIQEVYDAMVEDFPRKLRYLSPHQVFFNPGQKVKPVNKVRECFWDPDSNALFAVFGGTYFRYGSISYPVLVKKDLDSGHVSYLLSENNIRRIARDDSFIYVAPWHEPNIYVISQKNLAIVRVIPARTSLPHNLWEPMDVLRDVNGKRLYVSTEFFPVIQAYDLDSGKMASELSLFRDAGVGIGGVGWQLFQSPATRKLYAAIGPSPQDLIEVDPDTLEITRALDLKDIAASAMAPDWESGVLYYQSGERSLLFKIDLDSFKVLKDYKETEQHARRLTLDKARNVIYVLGYCSGKVFPLDLETGRRLWEVRVGGRPHGMDLNQDALWINSMAGAFRLDLPMIWRDKGYGGSKYQPD